jgi:hypothetical protein
MTAATARDSHRAFVAARKKRSRVWRVIHFLGSLKIALFLLATIAIAIATATFYESSFNTKVAQAYIYKAPWFLAWLGILCLNLFAVTLTRWPWQRKHLGFVITHYGIITLLIGAVIGSYFGFEGNVTLHTDKPAVDRITTSRSMVQMENPTTGGFVVEPFDPALVMPSEKRPAVLNVPGSDLKLVVDSYSENLVTHETLVPSSAPDATPGATIHFSTAMMGQQMSLPFLLGADHDFFGLATIRFESDLPKLVTPLAHETQMVFAKFAPVAQAEGGATGVSVKLSTDGKTLTITGPNTPPEDHPLADATGRTLHVGNVDIEVGGYWPDFKIVNGKPASISEQPHNPAVLVRISGPALVEPGTREKPILDLAPGEGGLRYQLSRGGRVYSSGLAKIGESFPLGWADWKATVTEQLPKAGTVATLEPGPADTTGISGLHGKLRAPDGAESSPKWLRAGELTPLILGGKSVRIGYGLELRPVPFTIRLKNFEVPRVEGTETPSNFIATVEFRDARTGATQTGVAQMNHPASWPGTAFAVTTGLNYKFSQAEWNPNDLGQTTLQVLYDPGWMFKWVGSLAICIGIFIMFYLRPKRS